MKNITLVGLDKDIVNKVKHHIIDNDMSIKAFIENAINDKLRGKPLAASKDNLSTKGIFVNDLSNELKVLNKKYPNINPVIETVDDNGYIRERLATENSGLE